MSREAGRTGTLRAGVLLEMMDLVSGVVDLDDALPRIAQFARQFFNVSEAGVFLYGEGRKSVTLAAVAASGDADPAHSDDAPPGDQAGGPALGGETIALRIHERSVFARVLDHDGVLEITDPAGLQDVVDFSKFKVLYLAPMVAAEGVLGVMLLGMRNGETPDADSRLDRQGLRLFAIMARQAAVIISRARLFANLEKSEDQYRRLTENASDIVFSLDASGRFAFLNSRVYDILGYRPEELVGQYYSEIVTPESWEGARNALKSSVDAGSSQVSYEWVATPKAGSAKGDMVLLDVRASILTRDGQYAGQQGIARDVTEQRRMEQEIRQSRQRQSEMRDYLALVTRVQEEERKRVARELHDDTAQALIALSRRLEMAIRYVKGDPAEACRRLEELAKLVDTTLGNVRRFTRDLRPPVLDDLGLIPALEWLVSDIQEHYAIKSAVVVEGEPRRLPPDLEVALFRIAQEALNNVTKHAQAASATVRVEYAADTIRLIIQDDGTGFDAEDAHRKFAAHGRLGIVGMNERAQLIGGELKVSSSPSRGTTVGLEVPIRKNA
ncbi:MAG: PAS domain S-box protein [Firmicutes bacterium]|nr:PAS domain S-box protein [Bacillota bacterium]